MLYFNVALQSCNEQGLDNCKLPTLLMWNVLGEVLESLNDYQAYSN